MTVILQVLNYSHINAKKRTGFDLFLSLFMFFKFKFIYIRLTLMFY
jgi:hypothetical protein